MCKMNVNLIHLFFSVKKTQRRVYYEKRDEFIEEIQKSRRGHDLSEDDVDEHKSDIL